MPPINLKELVPSGFDLDSFADLRVHLVDACDDPLFDVAYNALAAYFGARGQLESREDLARLTGRPLLHRGSWSTSFFLLVLDSADAVVAVAARYVVYEPATRIFSALDGSIFTDQRRRGAGIGVLVPLLFVPIGQRLLAEYGATEAQEVLEIGDLDIAADLEASIRRARVWERAGYRALPRFVFPFELVGVEDRSGARGASVPMLAVIRARVTMSRALLHALARHLEAAHAWADDAELAASTARLHAAIAAAADDPVVLPSISEALGEYLRSPL
jgi:hypothetical protein